MFVQLRRGRKPKKEAILEALAKEDIQVLGIAYAYALHLSLYGVDITDKLETVTQNAEAMEKAYQKGYYDAMQRVNSMEKFESNEEYE